MLYNQLTINGHSLTVGIYSPYFEKIDSRIVEYQKMVFDKFDLKINQILTTLPHGKFLTDISKNESVDYILFFDIDAIPLRKDFIHQSLTRVLNKRAILGIEQKANHIPNPDIYAGPACFLISKDVYNQLGQPSYDAIRDLTDVGQYLTILSKQQGITVEFFKFKECSTPMWELDNTRKFGLGSIYEDLVFHNFNSRKHSGADTQRFIDKCIEILKP